MPSLEIVILSEIVLIQMIVVVLCYWILDVVFPKGVVVVVWSGLRPKLLHYICFLDLGFVFYRLVLL